MAEVTLNTTDYAVLGLLNRQPWSAYELTQYMRTSYIRAVWPRAESRLYESPKKLAKNGYATVSTSMNGKRQRATYTITDAGRDALAAWLKEPGKGFIFEYEALLKMCFGNIDNAVSQKLMYDTIADQGQQDADLLASFFESFAEEPFEMIGVERAGQNYLVNAFIKEILDARLRWADTARQFQSAWDNCDSDEEKLAMIQDGYRESEKD